MKKETWKDIFLRQIGTGNFWKNLFKDGFDKHKFLDRSDAVYICKKAQADVYEDLINKLEGKIDATIIDELKQILDEHWKCDDSALGMFTGDKQIKS